MRQMDKKYKIYVYTNKINGKKYVGQTCRTLKERAGKDGHNYHNCNLFGYAIKKYGWDNFESKIVFDNLTHDDANRLERTLIKILRTQNHEFGYNIDSGGNDNTYNSLDITGQKFGRWTAIKLAETPKGATGRYWLCKCECGTESVIRQCNLTRGLTKSCGCLSREINSQIKVNDIIKDDDNNTIVIMNDVNFIIDNETYDKIKNNHFYYDRFNKRILGSHDVNLYKILFPDINKPKISNYIKHINNDKFDFRKENLSLVVPYKNINYDEFIEYLKDGIQGLTISSNGNKKWVVKLKNQKQKSFKYYKDAKEYILEMIKC